MFRRTRPENVCARLAPEHANRRIRRLVRQRDQRNYDSDEDSLKGSQQDHASESGQGPDKLCLSDFENETKVRRLDQSDRVNNDDGGKSRLRHQSDEGSEEEHRQQRERRRDELRKLRPRTGKTVDRGLCGTAAGRYRAQERASHIRQSGRRQLLIWPKMRLVARREDAPGRDRFGETHQRNAERSGPELPGK